LLATHALALALGIVAGVVYFKHQSATVDDILASLSRQPTLDAAHFAYRFGKPEHARALLTAVNDRDDIDTLFSELKLAVLDGEHLPGSSSNAHLERARDACQRFRGKGCDPEGMRKAAAHFAKQRQE
jgi:hypothetical protein